MTFPQKVIPFLSPTPYRPTQYAILRLSVWHCLEMSYRFPQFIWLNKTISYLHYTSSSPHKHFSWSSFSSFRLKTCWLLYFKCKSLLVTLITQEIISKCCQNSDYIKPFRRVRTSHWVAPSSNVFERFLASSVIIWLWFTCLKWFVVD